MGRASRREPLPPTANAAVLGLAREVRGLTPAALLDQIRALRRYPDLRAPGTAGYYRWQLLLAEQRRRQGGAA